MTEDVLQQAVEKLHAMFDRSDVEIELKKIQRKMEEAKYNPGDVKPFADCILAILLAARSEGFSVADVMQELHRTASAGLSKRWKRMPDGTYQAI